MRFTASAALMFLFGGMVTASSKLRTVKLLLPPCLIPPLLQLSVHGPFTLPCVEVGLEGGHVVIGALAVGSPLESQQEAEQDPHCDENYDQEEYCLHGQPVLEGV